MQLGVVKKYFEERGFGFIKNEGGGKDIFFHLARGRKLEGEGYKRTIGKDVESRRPKPQDRVVYVNENTNDGLKAVLWAFADECATEETVARMPRPYSLALEEANRKQRRKMKRFAYMRM